MTHSRSLYLYYKLMETAMADDVLSWDEHQMTEWIFRLLNLTDDDFDIVCDHFEGRTQMAFSPDDMHRFQNPDPEEQVRDKVLFQTILVQAMVDGKITGEEWAIIETLGSLMGIADLDRTSLEQQVRSRLGDEAPAAALERLEAYLTQHSGA